MSAPADRPVVWSIAGTDSAGGAGLAADQRAVEALEAHLCPVVAVVTAQNSTSVRAVHPLPPFWLDAQLQALAADLPPAAIKCGLLGGAAQVHLLASWVDRLRATHGRVPLVVDPVLSASTGARLTDAATLAACLHVLLPRASVCTPNRREAAVLTGCDEPRAAAAALRAMGVEAVCVTGGDEAGPLAADWLDTPTARGWLTRPREPVPHGHGTGCSFASAWAAALARGFCHADAAVLAKMAVTDALRRAGPLGAGAGPVRAAAGFALRAGMLPRLSPVDAPPPAGWRLVPETVRAPGIYAVVDHAAAAVAALRAGAHTVQLRIKRPAATGDSGFCAHLTREIAIAVAAARAQGRPLFVNDHWREAIAGGAHGVHLGHEDLQALGADERATLDAARQRGLALGLSSHSLWELARAAHEAPDYIACGPVWPTSTKPMPWRPQGLDNLAWWAAVSPAPVVAIGGVLNAAQVVDCARAGATGVALVRALQPDPAARLPALAAAWAGAPQPQAGGAPHLPHPSL